MADEQKQQSQAPSGAPRREGSGGHGGGHGPGGGHGGPRREGGPGGPGGGPGGPRRGKRQYFRKKKVCKFCVEKMDFIDYKRADILSQFVQERGKIEKTEHWGTRKLAYRVAKHREGIYVYQQIRTAHHELIAELERRLRVQDVVIKYLTVRLDEDLKRQKKLVHKREQRAARRPRRTAPAPAPAAPTPAAPEQAAAS